MTLTSQNPLAVGVNSLAMQPCSSFHTPIEPNRATQLLQYVRAGHVYLRNTFNHTLNHKSGVLAPWRFKHFAKMPGSFLAKVQPMRLSKQSRLHHVESLCRCYHIYLHPTRVAHEPKRLSAERVSVWDCPPN